MKLVLLGFATVVLLASFSGCASRESQSDPLKYFTREQVERGKSYRRIGYVTFFVGFAAILALLLVFIYTGAAKRLDQAIAARIGPYPLRVLVYFALLFLLYLVVFFPLSFYRSHIVEHQYGFAKRTFGAWMGDWAKSGAISLVMGAVLVVGLYWLMKASPRLWWLLAAGGFGLYLAVVILLWPVLIDPVFNKFTPMADEEMRAEIVSLAARAGIEVGDVLVMDASRRTKHTNAYFTGWGRTKRIVLYDTLLQGHTKPEVLSVIAHEIGHWKYNHIYKGFFMAVVSALLALLVVKYAGGWLAAHMPLGAQDLASPSTLPLVFLILYLCSIVTMPVGNAISRGFERQADRTALELTEDGKTFVQMQVKLAGANASDVTPSPLFYLLFYTHPSTMERIAAGERYGG